MVGAAVGREVDVTVKVGEIRGGKAVQAVARYGAHLVHLLDHLRAGGGAVADPRLAPVNAVVGTEEPLFELRDVSQVERIGAGGPFVDVLDQNGALGGAVGPPQTRCCWEASRPRCPPRTTCRTAASGLRGARNTAGPACGCPCRGRAIGGSNGAANGRSWPRLLQLMRNATPPEALWPSGEPASIIRIIVSGPTAVKD